MPENSKRSSFLFLTVLLAAIVTIVISLLVLSMMNKPRVLLYGLDKRETRAVSSLLGGFDDIRILNQTDEAAPKVSRTDILVFRAGQARATAGIDAMPLPDSLLNSTVPSLRRSVASGNTYLSMPIFLDHYELAWDTDRLASLGLSGIPNLGDMEQAMSTWTDHTRKTTDARDRTSYALIIAGGDDENLLLLLSALSLAEGGFDAYQTVNEALAAGTSLAGLEDLVIAVDTKGDALTLGSILNRLSMWRKSGYLHPEWLSFTERDIKSILESGQAFLSAQTLSFHREVDYKAISRYSTGRFPNSKNIVNTALVAPLTLAAIVGKPSRMERNMVMMRALANPALAREAASVTGRATTLAASPAPDVQAADALSFAAASSIVVAGFYRDAFADEATAKRFAAEVRARLRR